MTEINNGKLFARIANVMASVRSLQKDGNNKQSNYTYVSSANAMENIGRAMAEHGLVIIPMVSGYKTETEGKCTRTTIEFNMHVCDADGNAFLAPWIGEGIDYGNPDKAANKAMTNATKYFLMKLFLVGAGDDDPDSETQNYESATKKTTQAQPRQATTTQRSAPTPANSHSNANAAPTVEQANSIVGEAFVAKVIAGWKTPADAYKWAAEGGFTDNEHSARTRWSEIVKQDFGNVCNTSNVKAVMRAFATHYFNKQAAKVAA